MLLSNHVHLLKTPGDAAGIARVMQHLGRNYVLHVNRAYRRTGKLWEGRHKASLVHANEYLLTCMLYIEMNPVAAGMVESPEQYRWSSYRSHAWGETDDLLSAHQLYRQSGANKHDFKTVADPMISFSVILWIDIAIHRITIRLVMGGITGSL